MNYRNNAGYYIMHIKHLNARLFNRLLLSREDAKYNAEQGKILSRLWEKEPVTATDLSIDTGLANNTLTSMLKKMEEQGLIYSKPHEHDQRKKLFYLTETGRSQEKIGYEISKELNRIFYDGFSEKEIEELNSYLERARRNLLMSEKRWKN